MQQQQQTQNQMQQPQPQFIVEAGHLVMTHTEATGLPQVKDATVNDRDRMQDLLAQEKYLTDGYNHGMIEASHDALFQVLKQNHDACHQMQRQLFNGMFKKGWYKLPVADSQAVMMAYQQFQGYRSQFPFPGQQGQGQQQQQAATQTTASATASTGAQAQQAQGQNQQQNQQLNQKVEQALREASQGHIPSPYEGRKH